MSLFKVSGWDWPDKTPPRDWITNPWGWPTRFGLGTIEHPIDPEFPMVYASYPPLSHAIWDERLQLEYSV